jgi:hypothetical protein
LLGFGILNKFQMVIKRIIILIVFAFSTILLFAQASKSTTSRDSSDFEPQGPSNRRIEIYKQIESDYDFKFDYYDLLNVPDRVYEDINPKSGYYYYFPKQYYLEWTPEGGYNFNINYLSAGKGIVITGKLRPNITQKHLQLIEQLVKNDLKSEPHKHFKKLQSIPVSNETKLSFSGAWGTLFDAKSLDVKVPSNFLDPINIALKANDAIDVANICNFLFGDNGVKGEITITPDGRAPAEPINVILKMDDKKTFGTIELNPNDWRAKGWKNTMPYPVVVKNLHLMRLENKGTKQVPKIYTWQMGDKEVTEGANVKFDASSVPSWIDNSDKIEKMWIEYEVKKCKDCDAEIIEQIMRGPPPLMIPINIEILSPLAFSKAAKMKVQVQSNQLDPSRRTKVVKDPFNVTEDGSTLPKFDLYVTQSKIPQFEYAITLIMADGKVYESGWQKNNGASTIAIGEEQIKRIFPTEFGANTGTTKPKRYVYPKN